MPAEVELPVCRWRGPELTPGRHGCTSPKLIVSRAGVSMETCLGCYARDHEPAPPRQPPAARPVCVHRGDVLRLEECATCAGAVQLKVFACVRHGACTPGKPLPPAACCASCNEYEAP